MTLIVRVFASVVLVVVGAAIVSTLTVSVLYVLVRLHG